MPGYVQELASTVSGAGSSWSATLTATPGSTRLIVWYGRASTGTNRFPTAITDSRGNTWTLLTPANNLVVDGFLAYTFQDVAPLVSGDTVTATLNNTTTTMGARLCEYDIAGGVPRTGPITPATVATGTAADFGNFAETAGDYVLALLSTVNTSGAITVPTGFTARGTALNGMQLADIVAPSTASPDIAWSWAVSTANWSGVVVAFGPSGAATGLFFSFFS